ADCKLAGEAGADIVFAPAVESVYPPGFRTYVEVHELQDVLCGAARPGHFRGVCTVVLKLLNMVQPDVAYFGQKDAQQALILTRMVRDLDFPMEMHTLPTVREQDGLALSSRNRYLTAEQRRNAPAIFRALQAVKLRIEAGERDSARVEAELNRELSAIPGARVDFARVVSAESLTPLPHLAGPVLIAVAVFFGTTRLIDNIQLHVPV
ncbi:MAG: pantoate--beta-alanine ligase, partial [Gemmataceae bacterium]